MGIQTDPGLSTLPYHFTYLGENCKQVSSPLAVKHCYDLNFFPVSGVIVVSLLDSLENWLHMLCSTCVFKYDTQTYPFSKSRSIEADA